jgi:hypothetical protein
LPDVVRSLFAQVVAHPFAAYGFTCLQGLRSWRCSQYSVVKVRVADIQRITAFHDRGRVRVHHVQFSRVAEGLPALCYPEEKSGLWSRRVPASPDFL